LFSSLGIYEIDQDFMTRTHILDEQINDHHEVLLQIGLLLLDRFGHIFWSIRDDKEYVFQSHF